MEVYPAPSHHPTTPSYNREDGFWGASYNREDSFWGASYSYSREDSFWGASYNREDSFRAPVITERIVFGAPVIREDSFWGASYNREDSFGGASYNREARGRLVRATFFYGAEGRGFENRFASADDRNLSANQVGCFGFNGPLRQYFSLYRAVSQREREK